MRKVARRPSPRELADHPSHPTTWSRLSRRCRPTLGAIGLACTVLLGCVVPSPPAPAPPAPLAEMTPLGSGQQPSQRTSHPNPAAESALITSWDQGGVWTWGRAGPSAGILRRPPQAIPTRVDDLPEVVALSAGLYHRLALAAGEHHSLALAADGQVWAWGGNVFGELGSKGLHVVYAKAPIPVAALYGVTAIAARGAQSLAVQRPGRRQLPQPSVVPGAPGSAAVNTRRRASRVPDPVASNRPASAIAASGDGSLALDPRPAPRLPVPTFGR